MPDSDIEKLTLKQRIALFQDEYNKLAHKYGVDFTCVLRPTDHSLEAQIAYKDLLKPEPKPKVEKLPN